MLPKLFAGAAVCAMFGIGLPTVAHADSAAVISETQLANTRWTSVIGQGAAGGVLSLSQSRTVSNQTSGDAGVSWGILNGTVGFNITSSTTVSYQYSRSASSSSYCYRIDANDRWEKIVIVWHYVGWGPLPNDWGYFYINRHNNGVSYAAPLPYRVPAGGC